MVKKWPIPIAITFITLSCLAGSSCTNSNVKTTITVAASDSELKLKTDVICDGQDDQVQIQEAIDTGEKVVLREGTFHTSSEILLPSNITLEGKEMGATTIIGNGGGTHYRVIRNENVGDGNKNIVIRNITIDSGWSYPSQAGGNGGAITLTKCQDVTVENVEVGYSSGCCIEICQSENVVLTNVDVHHPGGTDCDGISVSDGQLAYGGSAGASVSTDILIEKPYIHDISSGSGIEIDDGAKLVEIHNPFFDNIVLPDIELHVHSGEIPPERVIIRGGTIPVFSVTMDCKTRWELYDLTVGGGGAAPGGYIWAAGDGCKIMNSNITCARIAMEANDLHIEDSVINASLYQVYGGSRSGYRILNNTIIRQADERECLYFAASSKHSLSDMQITGNTFENVTAKTYGLHIGGYADLGTLSNFYFESNSIKGDGSLWTFGGDPMGSFSTATLEDSVFE